MTELLAILEKARGEVKNHNLSIAMRGNQNAKNGKREKAIASLAKYAVPMKKVEFTKENYDRLFPGGRVNTPLGVVKMGEHQFEKLEAKGRTKYLGAAYQTLKKPVFIVETEKDGKKYNLFIKSFCKEDKGTMLFFGVVVDIKGELISISSYPNESMKKTVNRIKNGSILYEKDTASVAGTRTVNSPSSLERQPASRVSSKPFKKSRSGRLLIKKKLAREILAGLEKNNLVTVTRLLEKKRGAI